LISATSDRIKVESIEDVDGLQRLDHNVVAFDDEFIALNQELKSFLFANMYKHYRVVRMQTKAERFIEDLFKAYTETPAILPAQVQEKARQAHFERTICDYLAGMTDRFALQEHSKLFDSDTRP
jgi:dGTPase